MSRTVQRLFSTSLRSSVRANALGRTSRAVFSRRMMSSESHASHGDASGDRPWMIGSALLFGPLFLYLVSPSARKGSSHGHEEHGHGAKHTEKHTQPAESHSEADPVPIADDEGNEVSAQEVKESLQQAVESDSPKDTQAQEEAVAEEETEQSAAAPEQPATEKADDSPEATASAQEPTDSTPSQTEEAATAAPTEESSTVEKTESIQESQA